MPAGFFTNGQSMFGRQDPLRVAPGSPQPTPTPTPAPQQPQTIDAQAIRPSSGTPNQQGVGQFDPSYLQNLATYIGGLFSRPQNGALSFNPLGNLSDFPGAQGVGAGNAPTLGLPPTMLQNAINSNLSQQTAALPSPPALSKKQIQEQQRNTAQGTTGA